MIPDPEGTGHGEGRAPDEDGGQRPWEVSQPVRQQEAYPRVFECHRARIGEGLAGRRDQLAQLRFSQVGIGLPARFGVGRPIPCAAKSLQEVVVVDPEGATLEVVGVVLRGLEAVAGDGDAETELSERSGDGRGPAAVHAHHEQPWAHRHGRSAAGGRGIRAQPSRP